MKSLNIVNKVTKTDWKCAELSFRNFDIFTKFSNILLTKWFIDELRTQLSKAANSFSNVSFSFLYFQQL